MWKLYDNINEYIRGALEILSNSEQIWNFCAGVGKTLCSWFHSYNGEIYG